MKIPVSKKSHLIGSRLFIISFIAFIMQVPLQASSCNFDEPIGQKVLDTSVTTHINGLLTQGKVISGLYYPNAVKRFYTKNNFHPAWIKAVKNPKQLWESMLIIDCVLQFGLAHADYHPDELTYNKAHDLIDKPEMADAGEKARFDILLTDALLNLMNHLHYGKLNPVYTADILDEGSNKNFNAESVLMSALLQKDFMSAVLMVQPQMNEYKALQGQMRLIAGQYTGDCYEIPEGEIRQIAINMERLRWLNTEAKTYVLVNIPAYELKFYQGDSTYTFKVIVGQKGSETPVLQSTITHFTTTPDWKAPQSIFANEILPNALKDITYLERYHYAIYTQKGEYVAVNVASLKNISKNISNYFVRQSAGCDNALGTMVFRFRNQYDVYLHDTPNKALFAKKDRALSHGCIRLQNPEQLAALMLNDNKEPEKDVRLMHKAIDNFRTKNFFLSKPVPILITYLTCEMKDGLLVTYKDVYNKDKALEVALYNITSPLAKK